MVTDAALRPRLERRRVLETALEIVDRDGLEALTMRRLGNELGVDPMAVYDHVDGKERLFDGIAELLWADVARPKTGSAPAAALRTLARSLRDLFRQHPAAAPLMLRWTTLPWSQLELFEAYLAYLAAAGVSEPAAVLRPLISYALGTGYVESTICGGECVPRQGRPLSERQLVLSIGQALPQGTPPALASAALAMIADCDADRCFEEGLDLMLSRFARAAGSTAPRRTAKKVTPNRTMSLS